MALRRVQRRIVPVVRRSTEWGFFELDFEVATPNTVIVYALFTSAALLDFENPTVVRTHLHMLVSPVNDQGDADVHDQVAIGIGVAPQEAITAGALPSPTGAGSGWGGWLLHQWFDIPREFNTSTSFERRQLDSQAMRKVQEGDGVFASVATPATNIGNLNYSFQGRMLFKE